MFVYIGNILADTKEKTRDQESALYIFVTVPGLHSDYGRNGIGTVSMYRIPGFHIRHNQDGVEFACSKDKEDLGEVPTVIRGRAGDSQHPSRLIGKMNAINPVIHQHPCSTGTFRWTWQQL